MGTSSLGARKFAATFQAARKLLRCDVARPLRGAPTTVAQRGRAGHEFFAFPYLPLWVGEWGLNPPRWQSGCVWVGQLCGDSACGCWVRAAIPLPVAFDSDFRAFPTQEPGSVMGQKGWLLVVMVVRAQ